MTGPLQIRSDGRGRHDRAAISGSNSGRFQLGRASAAAAVPQLQVRHRGLDPRTRSSSRADLQPWKLDLKVAGGDLRVRGLGIDSRWTTDLDIGGTADAPRFTGRADLVRGDYDFAGRNFRLDRGVIRFRGESPPDPLLDIRAEAQVQGLDASVHRQRHRPAGPKSPSPACPQLPQDELLSRILFGTSITNLSAPEALQLASAVAALQSGSGSLDPINALRRAVGLDRLRIVPADVATGQKTAIVGGQVYHPQIVRRSDHRRAGLFRDAGRISDDALALAAVVDFDHRPHQRQRSRQQGLLSRVAPQRSSAPLDASLRSNDGEGARMKNWNVRKTIVAREDMPEHHRLAQSLSWPHLIALGVGAIVGTGILTLIGVGAAKAGPAVILSLRHRRRDLRLRRAGLCRNGDDDPGVGQRLHLHLCRVRRADRLDRRLVADPRI